MANVINGSVVLGSHTFNDLINDFVDNIKKTINCGNEKYVFVSNLSKHIFKDEELNYYTTIGLQGFNIPEIHVKGNTILIKDFLCELIDLICNYLKDENSEDFVFFLTEQLNAEKFDKYFDDLSIVLLNKQEFLYSEGLELRLFHEKESTECLNKLNIVEIKGFKNDSN